MTSKAEKLMRQQQDITPAPVDDTIIDYWSDIPIGGSGMSLSIQRTLKSMAQEIKRRRIREHLTEN